MDIMSSIDDIDDLDDSLDDLTFDTSVLENEIQEQIHLFDSKKLCQIIVCDKYFKLNKDMTVLCMEELAKRRIAGDDFKFEDFIDESLKGLPVLNFSIPDLRNVLDTASKNSK